jgi:hypothetical protein
MLISGGTTSILFVALLLRAAVFGAATRQQAA